MVTLMSAVMYIFIISGYYALIALLEKPNRSLIIYQTERNISRPEIPRTNARLYLLAFIYSSPLLVGHIFLADGIAKKTFEIMGVRVVKADISIEKKIFEESLAQLKGDYLPKDSAQCSGDTCLLRDTAVLFTGIGNKTKLQVSGSAGTADIIIPNSAIQLIIKRKPNTP